MVGLLTKLKLLCCRRDVRRKKNLAHHDFKLIVFTNSNVSLQDRKSWEWIQILKPKYQRNRTCFVWPDARNYLRTPPNDYASVKLFADSSSIIRAIGSRGNPPSTVVTDCPNWCDGCVLRIDETIACRNVSARWSKRLLERRWLSSTRYFNHVLHPHSLGWIKLG